MRKHNEKEDNAAIKETTNRLVLSAKMNSHGFHDYSCLSQPLKQKTMEKPKTIEERQAEAERKTLFIHKVWIIGVIAIPFLIYLSIGFIALNWNVTHWTEGARLAVVLFSAIAIVVWSLITAGAVKDEEL
jgi:protein-S-isoprenylcysteine O-methyltransferase Ste14